MKIDLMKYLKRNYDEILPDLVWDLEAYLPFKLRERMEGKVDVLEVIKEYDMRELYHYKKLDLFMN